MNSRSKFLASIFLASALVSGFNTRAWAGESPLDEHQAVTDSMVKSASWQDGKAHLDKMYQQVIAFNDYIFDSNLTARKKNKISKNGGRFYYKKRDKLRVEVKSNGRNNGAVVVKSENGNIRGSGGGALKFIKMNLDRNSRMLILPNGLNVVESDFRTLISRLKSKVQRGATVKVTSGSVAGYKWSGPVKVIDVKTGGVQSDRILVSPKTNVPIEWDLYQSGKLYSIAMFKNFKANPGLNDKLFEL